MRQPRRTTRLTLALVAAVMAGLLTAWVEPTRHENRNWSNEIADMTRDAREYFRPAVRGQTLDVARTIVSNNQ